MSGTVLLTRLNGTSDLCLNCKTVLVQEDDISVVLGCQGYNLTVFLREKKIQSAAMFA